MLSRTPRTLALTLSLLAAAVPLAACGHSLQVHRPADPAVDQAITTAWTQTVEVEGRDGDLVLRRGYGAISDVITFMSDSDDLSHAAVLDARRKTVIEANGGSVREVPLRQFVNGAHRVVLLRPRGLDDAAARRVLARARAKLGAEYDYTGFVGIDDPDKFYCTELAAWALAPETELHVGSLVEPGELLALGNVVYDSGQR
jgi:hypothetical protein